ncbi:MAG TPA: TRAP transporter large permease subunit, partial [Burkholderiales bacterium]
MSGLGLGLAMFAGMLALMALRVPIAIAMFIPGAAGYLSIAGEAPFLNLLKGIAYARLSNYDLSVIPLFLLMGAFATQGGLSRALFAFANALIGHVRGGMAMASVFACAAFGTVCGSSVATCATVTQVALPEMRRHGYSGRLATATMAAGGTLGILVPPSVVLVVYAIIVESSVLDMFRAALLPGLLAVFLFVVTISVLVRLRPELAPVREPMAEVDRRRAVRRLVPVAVIFGLLIGGLALGLFLPTPAAGVGASAVLVYGLVMHWRTGDGLTWAGLRTAVLETAVTAGMIYFILFGAKLVGIFFARSNLPQSLAELAV